jgi:hypothetical protein
MTTIDLIKWRVLLGNRALRATPPFSLLTWRKVEKPGVLFACSAFPGYSQLSHLCHLLVSYREKRDVDFDTFFETTHHFLFSTRLRPLTREEKLSQMCQETADCEIGIKLFGKEIVYSDKRTVYDLFRLCSSVYLAKAVQ